MHQTVAILGASADPSRYANVAQQMLREHGHSVIPVHPALQEIDGIPVVASLDQIPSPPDTLTLYVGAARLPALTDAILRLRPGRVIFNPGTESPELQQALTSAAIPWKEACTLVLLRTGQF